MLKKQPTIALSNTKIECRVVTQATCEAVWMEILLKDLGFTIRGKFKYFVIT